MNKKEFLDRLNQILSDLPEEERLEAVSYYEEYLEEAGPEREAELLLEFGSPERVAAEIRENLYGGIERGGVYTETGYRESTVDGSGASLAQFTQIVPGQQPEEQSEEQADGQTRGQFHSQDEKDAYGQRSQAGYDGAWEKEGKSNSAGKKMSKETKAILIALAILFAVPIGGVLIGLLGGLIGVIVGILGGLLGLIGAAIGFLVSSVAVVITGVMNLASATASGFLLCGIGCLLFVAGLLCVMATGFVFGTALPWLIRKIRQFFRWLGSKRKGSMA